MNPHTPVPGGSRGHLTAIAAYLRTHLPISGALAMQIHT